MPNLAVFTGNLASEVEMKNDVAKFSLIRNEYAGKDDAGNKKERQVTLQFSAFSGLGKMISENLKVGDQASITYRVENNNYETNGQKVYSFNFVVQEIDFGRKGKLHEQG